MSDVCEWCDGAGCDECAQVTSSSSAPAPTDCEWCDGAGCDQCQTTADGAEGGSTEAVVQTNEEGGPEIGGECAVCEGLGEGCTYCDGTGIETGRGWEKVKQDKIRQQEEAKQQWGAQDDDFPLDSGMDPVSQKVCDLYYSVEYEDETKKYETLNELVDYVDDQGVSEVKDRQAEELYHKALLLVARLSVKRDTPIEEKEKSLRQLLAQIHTLNRELARTGLFDYIDTCSAMSNSETEKSMNDSGSVSSSSSSQGGDWATRANQLIVEALQRASTSSPSAPSRSSTMDPLLFSFRLRQVRSALILNDINEAEPLLNALFSDCAITSGSEYAKSFVTTPTLLTRQPSTSSSSLSSTPEMAMNLGLSFLPTTSPSTSSFGVITSDTMNDGLSPSISPSASTSSSPSSNDPSSTRNPLSFLTEQARVEQAVTLYAEEVKIASSLGRESTLRAITLLTSELASRINDPRVMATLKETWGQTYGDRGDWEESTKELFSTFEAARDMGDTATAVRCLSCAMVGNIIIGGFTNPMDSKEANTYASTHEDLDALARIRTAYEKGDVSLFYNAMRDLITLVGLPDDRDNTYGIVKHYGMISNKPKKVYERWISRHLSTMMTRFMRSVLRRTLGSYARVKASFIANKLRLPTETTLLLMVDMILDGEMDARVDQMTGVVDVVYVKPVHLAGTTPAGNVNALPPGKASTSTAGLVGSRYNALQSLSRELHVALRTLTAGSF